jgi:hypothetical protein
MSFFGIGACLYLNSDSVHNRTEAASIAVEIMRANSDSSTSHVWTSVSVLWVRDKLQMWRLMNEKYRVLSFRRRGFILAPRHDLSKRFKARMTRRSFSPYYREGEASTSLQPHDRVHRSEAIARLPSDTLIAFQSCGNEQEKHDLSVTARGERSSSVLVSAYDKISSNPQLSRLMRSDQGRGFLHDS